MKKKFHCILNLAFAITASILIIACDKNKSVEQSQSDTLQQVLSSGKIRCGYVVYPPGLIKNPNTGKVSGIFAEVLEEAAKNLDLQVEWTEEVGWGTMVEGLNNRRYDMIGSPVWPLGQRIRVSDFTKPIYYVVVNAYVQNGNTKFDNALEKINSPDVRIATIDGELTSTVAKSDFPNARILSLPQMSDVSQLLLNVADGKADVTFVEPAIALEFMKNNPGKLQKVISSKPIRSFPNCMMVRQNDTQFRRLIDNALTEVLNSGFVDQVIKKYEPGTGTYQRLALPYSNE
jgi:polar amino acid transport system substrate-binding protein